MFFRFGLIGIFLLCAACSDNGVGDLIYLAQRPSFYTSISGTTQVIVPASEASPARAYINGKLYTNKGNVVGDLQESGRGGVDQGPLEAMTAYYLYAIPDETEDTFDLVISKNPPTSGPNGFPDWSYLGAFLSDSLTGVRPIFSLNGFATIEQGVFAGGTNGDVSSVDWTARKITPYPVTVTRHWGALEIIGGAVAENASVKGSKDTSEASLVVTWAPNGALTRSFGFVPATDGATVWIESSTTASAHWAVYGWEEDLLKYP